MSKCSLWDINSCCGWKRKEKKKLFLHFSICFVRKQSRWIICWAGTFLLHPAQIQVLLDLPDSQMHSHSAGVWSSTGYYWLTCLNSASWKSHSNLFSILPVYESCVTWHSFFLNIPHVPHSRRCKCVAFIFVAWETMLACLLTFHTWFHSLNL